MEARSVGVIYSKQTGCVRLLSGKVVLATNYSNIKIPDNTSLFVKPNKYGDYSAVVAKLEELREFEVKI